MLSPFPGMDPYLEAPDLWPDLHHALSSQIRDGLNRDLPAPYYARLEMRPEVGIVDEGSGSRFRMIPDVSIVRPPRPGTASSATALLDRPRAEVSRSFEVTLFTEPIRHQYVEIRDAGQNHKLITLIELLSPSNKRRGPDRETYERKQREVLESDASLIELDLLRDGERVLPSTDLAAFLHTLDTPVDYLVLVNRGWGRRDNTRGYQLFPIGIREMLPCIPVPLRENEKEILLDLQFVFNRAYEGGPYWRGAVDYSRPPEPPLRSEDALWGESLVEQRFRGRPATDSR